MKQYGLSVVRKNIVGMAMTTHTGIDVFKSMPLWELISFINAIEEVLSDLGKE